MRRVRKLKSHDVVLCFDCTCGKLRCTLTRVRKLCRVVVHRFDYGYGKFYDKHGVIC